MSFRLAVISFGVLLCQLAPVVGKEPGDSLAKSLEVLSSGEKRTLDFGESGSLVMLREYPKGPRLGAFRIDVGEKVRVLQGGAWNELGDAEFEKVLGLYCMASRGASPFPFIQVEVDASSDGKVLADLLGRLMKLHVKAPQLEPIKTVIVAKRTAPKDAGKMAPAPGK